MARARITPLDVAGRGLIAGAIGTALMTGYQMAVMKARGSEGSTTPAEVGKRIIEGVFQREVPENRIGLLNNVVHVLYGTSWGAVYGLVHASRDASAAQDGLLFGALVWGASLVELPALRLAPPVWQYPPSEAALDLSYHLVYGAGVAAAYALLER